LANLDVGLAEQTDDEWVVRVGNFGLIDWTWLTQTELRLRSSIGTA